MIRNNILPLCVSALFSLSVAGLRAQDTTTHGWPVTPFYQTQVLTGVFGEFRNTLSSNHFHNGVDIPKADGSPVYPVFNGIVTAIGTVPSQGDNAYVRVGYWVSGLYKSDAYVHINPNPVLVVGDSVRAFQTVLGTILPGLGHVHFTHGNSPYMNAIRPAGGFAPYIDNYPPDIRWVRFFRDETETEFTNRRLSGLIDIRAHIAETNAADPGGVTGSTSNNGTYIGGYRVYSADTATVVHQPPDGGVRYRFDRKPSDSYVGRVFASGSDLSTHIYTLTNGDGASYINNTLVVNHNSWNTALLPPGNYVVMVFAEDTRGLRDSVAVPVQIVPVDITPPAPPTLISVIRDSTRRITVRWKQNTESDLAGYRLYFSLDGVQWTQRESEAVLLPGVTSVTYSNIGGSYAVYFRLAAVDSAAPVNVSAFSDIYGVRLNVPGPEGLIVDGFDRTESSGSYHAPSHPFALTLGQSLPVSFGTAANEAVADGLVRLEDFPVVFWLLGDESVADETFSSAEQTLAARYLRGGGKLYVTGSEVAYDLDRPSGPSPEDRSFLHDMLKVRYAADDAATFSIAGTAGTVFADVQLRFGLTAEGSPYEEDSPDVITSEPGGRQTLGYGPDGLAGGAGSVYHGLVPGGTSPASVMVMAFPFETIGSRVSRDTLMRRVMQEFGYLTAAPDPEADPLPASHTLEQNYPNPFNPSTILAFQLAREEQISLRIYNLVGQEVAVLAGGVWQPGRHSVVFNAAGYPSGVYMARLTAGSTTSIRTMVLMK